MTPSGLAYVLDVTYCTGTIWEVGVYRSGMWETFYCEDIESEIFDCLDKCIQVSYEKLSNTFGVLSPQRVRFFA